jgi:hypothetical protein
MEREEIRLKRDFLWTGQRVRGDGMGRQFESALGTKIPMTEAVV